MAKELKPGVYESEPIVITDEEIKAAQKRYNENVDKINAMSDEEIDALIKQGKCPFEPENLIGVPLGMFHCEVCGEMVVAGVPHPKPFTSEDLPEITPPIDREFCWELETLPDIPGFQQLSIVSSPTEFGKCRNGTLKDILTYVHDSLGVIQASVYSHGNLEKNEIEALCDSFDIELVESDRDPFE